MEPMDIWRSAQLLIKQHGAFAPQECWRRAAGYAEKNDRDGEAVWEAIARAAEHLLESGAPGDVPHGMN